MCVQTDKKSVHLLVLYMILLNILGAVSSVETYLIMVRGGLCKKRSLGGYLAAFLRLCF